MKELMARQNAEKQAQEAQTAKREESHTRILKPQNQRSRAMPEEESATYWAG